jgi:sensor histidine kinase YesM
MSYNVFEKYRWLLVLILATVVGIATGILTCLECFDNREELKMNIVISVMIWQSQWLGHAIIQSYLDRKYPWLDYPAKRIIMGVLGVLIYTTISFTLLYYIIIGIYGEVVKEDENYFNDLMMVAFVSFFMVFTGYGYDFFRQWLKTVKDHERAKKEHIRSQYEVLKNQINPHFLFNSLNALTGLIEENKKDSTKFVKQLSQVYRYILDNKDREVVTLKEEMDFIRAYIFLNQIRYKENLLFRLNIENEQLFMIPPLALQIVVENCIKHNIISKARPLTVEIFTEENKFIVVKNNLQIKSHSSDKSSGIGLSNLRERYKYLSDEEVKIEENQQYFRVKLPLFKMV